jgi:hypothetical protein
MPSGNERWADLEDPYTTDDIGDPHGFDLTDNYLEPVLSKFVPNRFRKRAIAVDVTTDRERYERGDPVEMTVEFRNRLPLPTRVPTPGNRRWGWMVDDILEATIEKRRVTKDPSTYDFRAREKKTVIRTWNGRIRRVCDDGSRKHTLPDPGEHTITAFVATGDPDTRPTAETTIELA